MKRAIPLLAAALSLARPAEATRFYDFDGTTETNHIDYDVTWEISILATPDELQFLVPRTEDLPDDGEISAFRQRVTTTYECDPPADVEVRPDWYTVLQWFHLAGVSTVTVRVHDSIDTTVDIQGVTTDLSRIAGAFYTDYTETIQQVSGIEEAIRQLEETTDETPGYPGGDIGLAQRWATYLRYTLTPGSCPGPDDAASVWARGIADCDGYANVFISGLRSLSIPSCIVIGYDLPGGMSLASLPLSDPGHSYHAWAGAWSEGLQAFLPFDLTVHQLGFVDAQRVHLAYHEDTSNHRAITYAPGGAASLGPWPYPSFHQTNTGTTYHESQVRHVEDGRGAPFFTNRVTGLNAPGPVTGVPPGLPRDGPLELDVPSPFRSVLSISVRSREPAVVTVTVFDATGRRVGTPAVRKPVPAGESFFRWLPESAPSGVYFVRLSTTDGRARTARAVLVR